MNKRAPANLPVFSSLAADELVTENTYVGLCVTKGMGQPLLWCLGYGRGLWELPALPASLLELLLPQAIARPSVGPRGEDAWRGSPATPTSAFFLEYHCRMVIWIANFFFCKTFTALVKNVLQGSAFKRKTKVTLQGVASPTHSTTFTFKRPYQVEHN